ncbi:MAG: hypothetical protein FWC70_13360, partial [Defluviitaleaceae bacterium]|nr:hypothetical protein [Defluviitaleaceae bacterium]
VPTSDVRIFNAQKQKIKPRQAESLRRAVSGFLRFCLPWFFWCENSGKNSFMRIDAYLKCKFHVQLNKTAKRIIPIFIAIQ